MADGLHENEVVAGPIPVTQPTLKPTAKVTAGGLGGAVAVLTVAVLGQFGIDLGGEVAAALTTLFSFAASYMVKDKLAL